jgi:hypothetical protein
MPLTVNAVPPIRAAWSRILRSGLGERELHFFEAALTCC